MRLLSSSQLSCGKNSIGFVRGGDFSGGDFSGGYLSHRWAVPLLLVVAFWAQTTSVKADAFEKHYFLLPPELLSEINQSYSKAVEQSKRDRRKINRGPGRLFLEARGITFPAGAFATVSGEQLMAANTPENLKLIQQLVESYINHVVEGPALPKTAEERPAPFDPSAMDFETLEHEGIVYRNVTVIAHTPAELEITHQSGGATLPLAEMTPEIQARYGYDPHRAEVFLQSLRTDSAPPGADTDKSPQTAKSPTAAKPHTAATPAEDPYAVPEVGAQQDLADAGRRSYDKILCRDGRFFENVDVQADHMGFIIRRQAERGETEERVTFWDAPSNLLLDFEKFEELFERMLVAKDRTQLYELNRDGIDGGKPFHELAKDPPVGRGFVSVPEGYVFANMNWMSLPQPAVELVREIGTRSFALGDAGKLVGLSGSEWWNRYAGHKTPLLSVPSKLVKKEPSKLGVLYSVFNPEVPILGNTAGEILNLWVDGRTDKNGLLALVETDNGLFLGYYQEYAALEGGELTWEDAVSDKTKRFQLRRVSSQKIRQGERLLKLFDASARRILGAEFKEVGQLKLNARHYHAILERGVEAAVQDRVLPKGDGVQFPELGVATTTSPSFEKVVITDQVVAKLKDVLPQTYVFDVESQQRVIEIRKRETGGRVSLQESNPKRQKQNEVVDVSPDLDGGLRLTDGKVVYELKPVLGGTELVIWEAEPNKLRRF